MAVAWPIDLPSLLQIGLSYGQTDFRVIGQMEVGPPKVRRRVSKERATQQLTVTLSDFEHTRFWSFWENELNDGIESITFTDAQTETSRNWYIIPKPRFSLVTGGGPQSIWRGRLTLLEA